MLSMNIYSNSHEKEGSAHINAIIVITRIIYAWQFAQHDVENEDFNQRAKDK